MKNADIAHLFALQSLEMLFMYNYSSVAILIAYRENMIVCVCCKKWSLYSFVLVEN